MVRWEKREQPKKEAKRRDATAYYSFSRKEKGERLASSASTKERPEAKGGKERVWQRNAAPGRVLRRKRRRRRREGGGERGSRRATRKLFRLPGKGGRNSSYEKRGKKEGPQADSGQLLSRKEGEGASVESLPPSGESRNREKKEGDVSPYLWEKEGGERPIVLKLSSFAKKGQVKKGRRKNGGGDGLFVQPSAKGREEGKEERGGRISEGILSPS